jgi:hypothetical protein
MLKNYFAYLENIHKINVFMKFFVASAHGWIYKHINIHNTEDTSFILRGHVL